MWGRGNFSAIQEKNATFLLLLTSAQWQECIAVTKRWRDLSLEASVESDEIQAAECE